MYRPGCLLGTKTLSLTSGCTTHSARLLALRLFDQQGLRIPSKAGSLSEAGLLTILVNTPQDVMLFVTANSIPTYLADKIRPGRIDYWVDSGYLKSLRRCSIFCRSLQTWTDQARRVRVCISMPSHCGDGCRSMQLWKRGNSAR